MSALTWVAVGAVVVGLASGDVTAVGLVLSVGLLAMGIIWPGLVLLAITVIVGIAADAP